MSRQLKNLVSTSFGLGCGLLLSFAVGCSAAGEDSETLSAPYDPTKVDGPGGRETIRDVGSTCAETKRGLRLLRRLTRNEADASLRDIFPEIASTWDGVKLSLDPIGPIGFTNDADGLLVGTTTAKEMLKTAEDIGELISTEPNLSKILPCASEADAACASEYVKKFGRRLFRRPLSDDEVKRFSDYQQSVAGRSDFPTGIKWLTVSLVQSPYSFYRTELGEKADGYYALNQFEVATELAYVYLGSTPDEELLSKAEAGELNTSKALRDEAARLIKLAAVDDRWRNMDSFLREWLEYGKVVGQSRDADPTFATEVSPKLLTETRAFVLSLIFGNKGTAQDLMTAPYTYLDGRLATFYGFGNTSAAGFERVERPEGKGLGLLGQGSLLAATSHQTATSPTLRGLLFYKKFLCNPRPTPPAVVPTIEATAGESGAKTTREKFEEHHITQAGTCATCHANFEPFGYTMEQFDETGRYRADEDGNPINTKASIAVNGDSAMTELDNLESLANLVETRDDVENCISGLMADYFLSGAGGTKCLAEDARAKVASGDMTLEEFYLGLVDAPHFRTRAVSE